MVPRRSSLLVLALVGTLAGVPASPAHAALAGPEALSVESGDTALDGWGGWLVWSRRDAGGAFTLVARAPDGTGLALPAPAQRRPYDARIGPGPDGRPLVVYSRCAAPAAQPPTGCDVWRIDPDSGETRAVAAASRPDVDERLPTVWGTRIAFARQERGSRARRVGIAIAALDGPAPRRAVVHGPRNERRGRRPVRARSYGPVGLDLVGRRLAYTWEVRRRSGTVGSLRTALLTGSTRAPAVRSAQGLFELPAARGSVSALGSPALGGGQSTGLQVLAPVIRTGGGGRSTIVRTTIGGSRAWKLESGFTAGQTERYGSALSAVAWLDDARIATVRRLASDGRYGCRSAAAPGTEGCEVLALRLRAQPWRALR